MTDRDDAQNGIDNLASQTTPDSVSPQSFAASTLQPMLDASLMRDETGLLNLTEGQVGRSDGGGNLVYAGATVDPATNMWTFDAEITVPPGSVNVGSQSISNAGQAMQWKNLSTDEQFLYVSDPIPTDPMASSGDLIRYKMGPETVFDNQVTALDVISPQTGNDVFYIIPNAADGLNLKFSVIGVNAGDFDFFLRLNSHDDLPIFEQRETFTADDVYVGTVTNITQAATAEITFDAAHSYQIGDTIVVSEVVGMVEINLLTNIEVIGTTANSVTVDLDTTTFTAYASGGVTYKEKFFELTNPNLILGFGTLAYVELRSVDGSNPTNRGGIFDLTSIGLPVDSYLPWLRAVSRPVEIIGMVDKTNQFERVALDPVIYGNAFAIEYGDLATGQYSVTDLGENLNGKGWWSGYMFLTGVNYTLHINHYNEPNDFRQEVRFNSDFDFANDSLMRQSYRAATSAGVATVWDATAEVGDTVGVAGEAGFLIDIKMTQTIGGGWNEIARYTPPVNSVYKTNIIVDGGELGTEDTFTGSYFLLATRNGGAPSIVQGMQRIYRKRSTFPADFRARVDGNDIVYDVRGIGGETWNWNARFVFTEIDI